MSKKQSCGTCKHCVASHSSAGIWCRLRDISLHKEIARFAFCHHWSMRSPSLPKIDTEKKPISMDKQLEFSRELVIREN